MMKKHWKDKKGIGNLGLVASTAIVMVVVLFIAILVLFPNVLSGMTGTWDPPYEEDDTEETNPVFAYFSVSATLRWDNNELNNHVIYGMDSVSITYNAEPYSAQAFTWPNPMDWFNGHECAYQVQFKITGPTQADYTYSHTISGKQQVGANQEFTSTVNMGTSPGIRYEGSYHLTAVLIDGDGGIVTTLDKDIQVSK